MQGVSKRVLQWFSKHSLHSNIWNTIVKLHSLPLYVSVSFRSLFYSQLIENFDVKYRPIFSDRFSDGA
jgi:hypothetical protein